MQVLSDVYSIWGCVEGGGFVLLFASVSVCVGVCGGCGSVLCWEGRRGPVWTAESFSGF
jgi:hypothetical protein